MRSPIPDYLTEVLDACSEDTEGELAAYIPELAQADPGRLGLALATVDGQVYGVGDHDVAFSIQSISKPFAYALAIAEHGLDAVLERVGVEPSGDAFNELSLELGTGRPFNPMINAGALTVHAMLDDDLVARGFSAFAGRKLEVDEEVFTSELDTADRNRAIAFMLRSHGIIERDAQEAVEGYTRQCSLLVTARDLAVMAATLANAGVQPVTGERVVPREVTRQVMAVMATCGMYDAAGDWFTSVGIPAKSGVAGGLIGALPGQAGLATFSPPGRARQLGARLAGLRAPLPRHGHAPHGGAAAGPLAGAQPHPDARRRRRGLDLRARGLGELRRHERVLRHLAEDPPSERGVLLDLTRVTEVRDVGRRMLLEAVRRLDQDGHEVVLVDPDAMLEAFPDDHTDGDLDAGDGVQVPVRRQR